MKKGRSKQFGRPSLWENEKENCGKKEKERYENGRLASERDEKAKQDQQDTQKTPPCEQVYGNAEPTEMVNDTAHDQVSEDHGHQGGQDADMGHTENRIEYHGRPEQAADQLPRRNAEYAADMPFTEKQHSDPKNQRTAKE